MITKNESLTFLLAALVTSSALAGCAATDSSGGEESVEAESDFTTAYGTGCVFGRGLVTGAIEAKYLSLGGCVSFLGVPVHGDRVAPDGRGRYAAFLNGSIYWRHDLGAHVVRGEIRELWRTFGWEAGPLGYPLTDETLTPDGRGRYGVFEGGSIYWTMQTGAHEVRGAIRDKWSELGWEAGPLGYPIAGETQVPGGIRSYFEHGFITWTRDTDSVDVVFGG